MDTKAIFILFFQFLITFLNVFKSSNLIPKSVLDFSFLPFNAFLEIQGA